MAVEFALVLIPLLTLVFGILQYGMYFYSAQTGTSVAREALRRVSVGDCQDDGQLQTYISSRLGSASVGAVTVDRTYMTSSRAVSTDPVVGGIVELRVEFATLNMNFPFLPFPGDPEVVRVVDSRTEDDIEGSPCT